MVRGVANSRALLRSRPTGLRPRLSQIQASDSPNSWGFPAGTVPPAPPLDLGDTPLFFV